MRLLPESNKCWVNVCFTAVFIRHAEWSMTHWRWVFYKALYSTQRHGQLEWSQALQQSQYSVTLSTRLYLSNFNKEARKKYFGALPPPEIEAPSEMWHGNGCLLSQGVSEKSWALQRVRSKPRPEAHLCKLRAQYALFAPICWFLRSNCVSCHIMGEVKI